MTLIQNGAVFEGGRKRTFTNVDVEVGSDTIVVKNRISGAPVRTYNILEEVSEGQAWDVTYENSDAPFRLVAQTGCGCSGVKSYPISPSYSGRFSF